MSSRPLSGPAEAQSGGPTADAERLSPGAVALHCRRVAVRLRACEPLFDGIDMRPTAALLERAAAVIQDARPLGGFAAQDRQRAIEDEVQRRIKHYRAMAEEALMAARRMRRHRSAKESVRRRFESRAAKAEAQLEELREALSGLVDAEEATIEPSLPIFQAAFEHGVKYQGPSTEDAMEHARAVLGRPSATRAEGQEQGAVNARESASYDRGGAGTGPASPPPASPPPARVDVDALALRVFRIETALCSAAQAAEEEGDSAVRDFLRLALKRIPDGPMAIEAVRALGCERDERAAQVEDLQQLLDEIAVATGPEAVGWREVPEKIRRLRSSRQGWMQRVADAVAALGGKEVTDAE